MFRSNFPLTIYEVKQIFSKQVFFCFLRRKVSEGICTTLYIRNFNSVILEHKELVCVEFTIEKTDVLEILISKFKKFIARSVFGELQLTQISLNFQNSCCNLKIRGLVVKLCAAFLLFLF